MLICMALSGAKCAMQLQRFKQASDCIDEVPLYTGFLFFFSVVFSQYQMSKVMFKNYKVMS